MAQLEIFLFGMPKIRVDGTAFTKLASRKARALLFYLALTEQQHARQTLAGLFWGEMSEANARRNLRVTLTKLKAELGEFLLVRRRTLAINPEAAIWLDVAEFENCIAATEPTLEQLQCAAALYGGHFLDGFYLRDAPMFEDWIRPLQERYRQMAMETLYRLAVYHTQQKQYGTGIDYAGRLLTLEPWMEEAHRQMMLLQALSGQRSAALAQFDTCRAMLSDELGVDPTEATTSLYKQILNEDIGEDLTDTAVSFPTPTLETPFQSPPQSPHFVGRLMLIGELSAVLKSAKSQQIHALVGMGGIGKSTVAVQLTHLLRSSFADGVLWAQAATAEPMAILESWAQAYGYDFTRIGDVESMAAAFRSTLTDKSVLIVLDDVRSMARIRPLLPNGNQNQVLITTRNQDLARSLNAQVWPLQELLPENGRLLLTSILGETRTGDEPEAATEICELLDNHPLAVEITAQRLKSRPRRRLTDMANRLRDEKQRLTLLAISDREVRASFAVSWQALDTSHRRVFALLGLFNGRSFTAEAIAHIAELDQYTIEDRLFALTALSLIREEGKTRYRQHPLLADFAREQLEEDTGEGKRFATYYLNFAQQHQHNYDALRPEWANMTIAMEIAYTQKLSQNVIDFAYALQDAWSARGRFIQARQGYNLASKSAQKIQDNAALANISLLWGKACVEQNDYEEATKLLQNSLSIYEHLQEKSSIANVLYQFARIALDQNQYEEAKEILQRCQNYYEEVSDQSGVAASKYQQARIFYSYGPNYRKSEKLAKEALIIQETNGDKYQIIPTLRLLMLIARQKEEFDLALTYGIKAHNFSEEIEDQGEIATSLYYLTTIYRFKGEYSQALSLADNSLALLKNIGNRRIEAMVKHQKGLIFSSLNEHSQALTHIQESYSIYKYLNDVLGQTYALRDIGDLYLKGSQPDKAQSTWFTAEQIGRNIAHKKLYESVVERLKQVAKPG